MLFSYKSRLWQSCGGSPVSPVEWGIKIETQSTTVIDLRRSGLDAAPFVATACEKDVFHGRISAERFAMKPSLETKRLALHVPWQTRLMFCPQRCLGVPCQQRSHAIWPYTLQDALGGIVSAGAVLCCHSLVFNRLVPLSFCTPAERIAQKAQTFRGSSFKSWVGTTDAEERHYA